MTATVRITNGLARDMFPVEPTAITTGELVYKDGVYAAFQAIVTGVGIVNTSVNIETSNDGLNWNSSPLGVITTSGNNAASDGFTSLSAWKFVRANITALSGTDAKVRVLMGV